MNLQDGGLGISGLRTNNHVFLKKLFWNVFASKRWSTNFLKKRYLKDNLSKSSLTGSSFVGKMIKDNFTTFLEENHWLLAERTQRLIFWITTG